MEIERKVYHKKSKIQKNNYLLRGVFYADNEQDAIDKTNREQDFYNKYIVIFRRVNSIRVIG